MGEPERQSSAFASKTQKNVVGKMLTSDIDYVSKPELVGVVHGDSPGSLGYTWPRHEHEVVIRQGGDGLLDCYYDVDYGGKQALVTGVHQSSRKYASSFTSASKRFPAFKD